VDWERDVLGGNVAELALTLFEESGDALFLFEPESERVLHANPMAQRLSGFGARELKAHPVNYFFRSQQPGGMARLRQAYLKTGLFHSQEGFLLRHRTDGHWVPVNLTVTRLHVTRSEPAGRDGPQAHRPHTLGLITARDISERLHEQAELRTSEAKYRSLVENLEQCIFLKDRAFCFVAANRRFCEIVGRPEAEVLGRTDADFDPSELAAKYRADDLRVLTSGRRLEMEEESLMDGRRCAVRVVKTPVLDNRGQIVGVLGIFWDVTEQRQLEEQLRQAQKMEAVGQMAGGIAHDFNNLLTAILGNVGLIQSHLPDGHACEAWLAAVEKAAVRGAGLTRQMLGFSRRTVLRPSPTSLHAVVEEVLSLLVGVIDPRIVIEKHLAAGDGGLVHGDAGLLHQMLLNLCLNARDAMPDGGRLVLEAADVTLTADDARGHLDARPGEFVRLRVRDTGHGIPPHVLPRIFDPFFTTKAPGKGTGLGLSVAYGIVRQHQGWLTCASEPGAGTRFDVHLPGLERGARQGEQDAASTKHPAGGRAAHCTESILLVDDEPFLRELGRTVLTRSGYTVLTASDGVEAVEMFRGVGGRVDLVVMDLTMPRLSGLDAFRQIRALHWGSATRPVRVLFVSGQPSDGLDRLTSDPSVAFLPKPYRPEHLAKSVRELLDRNP
jgi:two-component system cell cycle sensor histidine kinase/response regulator CckA